jgi:hypothetical protein
MSYRNRSMKRRAVWAATQGAPLLPADVITFNGQPITWQGEYVTMPIGYVPA